MLPASQSACVTVEVAAIATEARTRLPITAMTATRAESRFVMQTLPGEVGTCTYQRGPYAFARPPAIGRFGIGRGPRDPRAGDTACFRARSRLGGRSTVYRTADGVGFWRANGGPGGPRGGSHHMTGTSTGVRRATIMAGGLSALAMGLTACGSSGGGSSSASTDPVGAALSSPGVRVVLVPKQKSDLTIVVPPCSEAQTVQSGTTKAPPGSNEVVIPKNSLTEAIAVQACQQGGASTGSSSGGGSGNIPPPPSNTILVTPGGAGAAQTGAAGGSSSSGGQQQNQVVLPSNANVNTIIVPPCTTTSSASASSQPSSKTLSLPSGSKSKIVAAPPCTAPAASSSS